jgi:hypothetical protein
VATIIYASAAADRCGEIVAIADKPLSMEHFLVINQQEEYMADLAFSYLRFSTPEQSAGDSHRRQLAMAVKYAADHPRYPRQTTHDPRYSARGIR